MFSTKYKSSFLLAIYCLISISCAYFSAHGRAYKKAQSANKRGHYEKAVYASVDALRIKPDYEEVEKIMDEAFPKTIRKHHKKIERLQSHQKDFYWDKILNELKLLKDLKLSIEELDHKKSQICHLTKVMGNWNMKTLTLTSYLRAANTWLK